MNRPLAVLAAAGLSAGLALATAPAHASAAAPAAPVKHAAPAHVDVLHVRPVSSRTVTSVNPKTGIASVLTVTQCSGAAPLYSPFTRTQDNKLSVALAWQEQTVSGSGRPEARINSGNNAVFLTNNHPASDFRNMRWTDTTWGDRETGDEFGSAQANSPGINFPGPSTAGAPVSTDGWFGASNIWFNSIHNFWGYRQWVENYLGTGTTHLPTLKVKLTVNGTPNALVWSTLTVTADGVCGEPPPKLVLY